MRSNVKFTVHRERLTKTLNCNHGTVEHFPSHLTTTLLKGLLTAGPFISTACLAIKKKITRHPKRHVTPLEETEKALEPDLDMARRLE